MKLLDDPRPDMKISGLPNCIEWEDECIAICLIVRCMAMLYSSLQQSPSSRTIRVHVLWRTCADFTHPHPDLLVYDFDPVVEQISLLWVKRIHWPLGFSSIHLGKVGVPNSLEVSESNIFHRLLMVFHGIPLWATSEFIAEDIGMEDLIPLRDERWISMPGAFLDWLDLYNMSTTSYSIASCTYDQIVFTRSLYASSTGIAIFRSTRSVSEKMESMRQIMSQSDISTTSRCNWTCFTHNPSLDVVSTRIRWHWHDEDIGWVLVGRRYILIVSFTHGMIGARDWACSRGCNWDRSVFYGLSLKACHGTGQLMKTSSKQSGVLTLTHPVLTQCIEARSWSGWASKYSQGLKFMLPICGVGSRINTS